MSSPLCKYVINTQVKRKNGRKYYPPPEFVPADVGPDGRVVVPVKAGQGKGNGVLKTEAFRETEDERRKREAEEEKEELERKVRGAGRVGLYWFRLIG